MKRAVRNHGFFCTSRCRQPGREKCYIFRRPRWSIRNRPKHSSTSSRAAKNRNRSRPQAALNIRVNNPAQAPKNSSIYTLHKIKGAGHGPHTLLGDQRAADLALRKNRNPKERIAAPTNSVSTGLAVIMSHTMPMPDTITSPASVSRPAAVTGVLVSGITSFTK